MVGRGLKVEQKCLKIDNVLAVNGAEIPKPFPWIHHNQYITMWMYNPVDRHPNCSSLAFKSI